MKSSILIKSLVASFLSSLTLISWRIKQLSQNNFALLMYHRVLPKGMKKGIQGGMYVEQGTFERHIKFLKNHFKIISPADLLVLYKKSYAQNNKPICLLTFDDGYYDLYKYAFPILKTYQVPATIFLPVEFIGGSKWFWTDNIVNLLLKKQEIVDKKQKVSSKRLKIEDKEYGEQNKKSSKPVNVIVNQIKNLKGSYNTCLERAIQLLKTQRDEEIEEVLLELYNIWAIDKGIRGRAFLTWDEVREMAHSGLVSFGSHTMSHRILTKLSDEEIAVELKRSKDILLDQKIVDPSFIPFCYPNGNYNKKIIQMVKETGYSLAVTTEYGWNSFGDDPFTLKRIGIHQDISSTEAMFACRVAGFL